MANLSEVFAAKRAAAAQSNNASMNPAATGAGGPPTAAPCCKELLLLVDALPARPDMELITLEEYVASLCEEVAREHNVVDWRALEYGQGRPQLASKVRAKLDLLFGRLVITAKSDSDLYRAVGEVLMSAADTVFVGVR